MSEKEQVVSDIIPEFEWPPASPRDVGFGLVRLGSAMMAAIGVDDSRYGQDAKSDFALATLYSALDSEEDSAFPGVCWAARRWIVTGEIEPDHIAVMARFASTVGVEPGTRAPILGPIDGGGAA